MITFNWVMFVFFSVVGSVLIFTVVYDIFNRTMDHRTPRLWMVTFVSILMWSLLAKTLGVL